MTAPSPHPSSTASKVEGEGIEFAPVRPDVGALAGEAEFAKKLWDPRKGPEHSCGIT